MVKVLCLSLKFRALNGNSHSGSKVNIARKARKGKYVCSHSAVASLRDTNLPGLSVSCLP